MRDILKSFLLQVLFWLVAFALYRLVFLFFNTEILRIENAGFGETLASFYHALHLDLATASYIMLIPFLLLVVQSLISPAWLNKVNLIYTGFVVAALTLLTTAELGIYPEWRTKMTVKALNYLRNPSEVFNSAGTGNFLLLVMLFFAQVLFLIWLYRKYFRHRIVRIKKNYLFSFLFLVAGLPLLVLVARGGINPIPINQSASYYSDKPVLNTAAVNSAFNFYINIFENLATFDNSNPFATMPEDEAKALTAEMLQVPVDTTVNILKTDRPNIIFVLLESWSADLIESLGGEPGITPEFRKLEEEGILFTQMYCTGPRSEQAMSSIFSGFPAHPISSVTVQPDKFAHIPTITGLLINEGYSTSFYFGGQLIYGNIKGYILQNGFQKIVEQKDFDRGQVKSGKLGVHDEYVFRRHIGDMKQFREPFFTTLFTLSSHSPYDQPMENVFDWGKNENDYINSAHYTDRSLGEYVRLARQQPWYNNTLMVIVADHSHNSYRNHAFTTPAYHKIPFLIVGGAIKEEFRGITVDRLSNQSDLAGTLLHQLSLPAVDFPFSRNLFNPHSPEFSYYSYEVGFGFIKPEGYFVYEASTGHLNENTLPPEISDDIIRKGKAYFQTVFRYYLDL